LKSENTSATTLIIAQVASEMETLQIKPAAAIEPAEAP